MRKTKAKEKGKQLTSIRMLRRPLPCASVTKSLGEYQRTKSSSEHIGFAALNDSMSDINEPHCIRARWLAASSDVPRPASRLACSSTASSVIGAASCVNGTYKSSSGWASKVREPHWWLRPRGTTPSVGVSLRHSKNSSSSELASFCSSSSSSSRLSIWGNGEAKVGLHKSCDFAVNNQLDLW